MDDFEERERRKFNDLGSQLGGIVSALSAADAAAKAATLDRQVKILQMDNIKATARTSIIGSDTPLQVDYDVPAAIVSDMRTPIIEEANIETTMNVTASTEDSTSISSETTAGSEASVGFGVFKASASFSSSVGVDKNHKRKSDYSSTLQVFIRMSQSEAPEGIMRILDSMNNVVKAATDINTAIIVQQQPALNPAQTGPAGSIAATPAASTAPAGGGS